MTTVNPENERSKRRYLRYLCEAEGLAEVTINHAAAAIFHFEQFTEQQSFKDWSLENAIGYKKHLLGNGGRRSAELSSRATVHSRLGHLQRFFTWLAEQPGYRSRIKHADVAYFNLSRRDAHLVAGRREKPAPTLEQARHVILSMPSDSDVELRNRALVACALLTGARVAALASLKLKHVRADGLGIEQDAFEVRTKFSKSQTSVWFPVGKDIRQIFLDYVEHLRVNLKWGADDPLFPATKQDTGADRQFQIVGLQRVCWKTADPIRSIFRAAFANANLPYFSPHTFRNCLALEGLRRCRTPEELKAWSQNLAHDEMLTTLTSYGTVPFRRQAELICDLTEETAESAVDLAVLLDRPDIRAQIREIVSETL